jgi:hypothetical protein
MVAILHRPARGTGLERSLAIDQAGLKEGHSPTVAETTLGRYPENPAVELLPVARLPGRRSDIGGVHADRTAKPSIEPAVADHEVALVTDDDAMVIEEHQRGREPGLVSNRPDEIDPDTARAITAQVN